MQLLPIGHTLLVGSKAFRVCELVLTQNLAVTKQRYMRTAKKKELNTAGLVSNDQKLLSSLLLLRVLSLPSEKWHVFLPFQCGSHVPCTGSGIVRPSQPRAKQLMDRCCCPIKFKTATLEFFAHHKPLITHNFNDWITPKSCAANMIGKSSWH